MKTLLILCGILAAVNLPAADGGLVARPATQAEVNAGTVRSKFVSPATLGGRTPATASSSPVTVTNLYSTYSTDTNTLVLYTLPFITGTRFNTNFTWVSSGGMPAVGYYTNNLSTAASRAWLFYSNNCWQAGCNSGIAATSVSLMGQWPMSVLTFGISNLVVTTVPAAATNTYATNILRQQEIFLTDFGGRGDGVKLYNVMLTNSVMIVTNGAFAAHDVGKFVSVYVNVTNTSWRTGRILTVNNSTNVTLTPDMNDLALGGMDGWCYTENTAAYTNAYNTAAALGGRRIVQPPGVFVVNQTFRRTNGIYSTIELPSVSMTTPFGLNNPAVASTLSGSARPITYPNTMLTNSAAITNSVGAPLSGTVILNLSTSPPGTTNVLFQHYTTFMQFDGSGYGTGWERYYFENFTVLGPNNPRFSAFWWPYGGGGGWTGITGQRDVPRNFFSLNGTPLFVPLGIRADPTALPFARLGTIYDFDGYVWDNCRIYGWPVGLNVAEHTELRGVKINEGGTAIYMDAKPGVSGVVMSGDSFIQLCREPIVTSTNGTFQVLHIECLGIEQHSLFPNRIYDTNRILCITGGRIYGDGPIEMESTNVNITLHGSDNSKPYQIVNGLTNNGALNQAALGRFYTGLVLKDSAVTAASIAASITNGETWHGRISNATHYAWMSNNVVTFKLVAP